MPYGGNMQIMHDKSAWSRFALARRVHGRDSHACMNSSLLENVREILEDHAREPKLQQSHQSDLWKLANCPALSRTHYVSVLMWL